VNNPDEDRDTTIDHLLGSTLKRSARADLAGACLDAETLAAWADDALDRQERAAVESHAAVCERCQAMMATLARAEHAHAAATVVNQPARRFPALAWLIPVTAIAAALLVWIAVPQRGPTVLHEDPAQAANAVTIPPAAPVGAAEAVTPPAEPEAAPKTSPRREAGRSQLESSNARADQPDALEKQRDDLRAKDEQAADRSAALTSGAAATNRASVDALAGNKPMTTNESVAQKSAAAPAAASPAAVTSFRNATASAPGTTIVSSNPGSRWRIVPGGAVQHTADGGSTWETQQTGSTVTLAAGASPSPSVCWLVGPAGTVLLSTDARTWRRIAFAEQADLVGVSATDDRTATVSFADGRTLTTTDAGVSWQR
jgi:hypothetical protein